MIADRPRPPVAVTYIQCLERQRDCPQGEDPAVTKLLASWDMTAEQQWSCIAEALQTFENIPPQYKAFEDKGGSNQRLVDRIGGQQLCWFLQPGDHLFVTHFDRLGCNEIDSLETIAQFAKRGVVVHVLDFLGHKFETTGQDDLTHIDLLLKFAQWSRAKISRNTKLGLRHKKRTRGYTKEPIPLGYEAVRKDGKRRIVPWPYAQRWANQIWSWRYDDAMTWQEIRNELHRNNVKGPYGGIWCRAWISEILKRECLPFPEQPRALQTISNVASKSTNCVPSTGHSLDAGFAMHQTREAPDGSDVHAQAGVELGARCGNAVLRA